MSTLINRNGINLNNNKLVKTILAKFSLLVISLRRRNAALKAITGGRVNWCQTLSIAVYCAICYWKMQDVWIYAPLADVMLKLQVLSAGLWLIYRRTRYVAFIKDDYLHVIQLPFKTILRLDEIQCIWFGDDVLHIQMKNGTELSRYYLFSVYPRLITDNKLQKLLKMR